MKVLIMTLMIAFCWISLSAQQTLIEGKVTEATTDKPVAGINVMVKNAKGKLLGFASSKEDGAFSIKLSQSSDSLTIHASMMGFKAYSAPLHPDGKPVEIRMEEGSLQLNELVVKGERIRETGDTITYDVGSFAQKQDKTIGDVLKRMPGIDVANNGKIQYQGTDINKFYIEGNDLLGGKYGIATNGIAHQDIGAVEVMENHQPMQVLRGLSFSEQAAINLKMKNRAKATFLVHGSLGGGWSTQPEGGLWQGDIFTMMVTGKYQMITTFKGNNTGVNLSDQLTDFTSSSSDEEMKGYISLSTPATPNLESKRSYLNRSWMVSSSHLFKTRKGDEIKAQVDYNNDRVTAATSNTTTYLLDSGDKVILEDKNSVAHRNAVTGKFSFEANRKTYFLNNTLAADFSWNDISLNTTGTLPNLQNARMPEFALCNLLKIIKRFGNNKLVTFTSRNEWNSMPERLTVINNETNYGERIGQHSFYTDERASLGFVFNRILLSLEAGIAGYFRNLDTDLWGIQTEGITSREELTTNYLRLFASPNFEWSYKKLELKLNLPVNFYSYLFSGGLRNRTEFFISPSLSARIRFSPRMSVSLRGSLRRSPASLHNIHDSSILTDYRSFSEGVDDYYSSSGQNVGVTYSFRNIQRGIFLTAMGSHSWNHSKFGTVQNIAGDYIFHSYRAQPSDSKSSNVFLNISKTLDFMGGAIGIKWVYRLSENNILSQGIPTQYENESHSISPFANGNITRYLNWNLRFSWNRSQLMVSGLNSRSADNFIYAGGITVTPCNLITWTTEGEFYRNQIEEGNYKNMLMLDTKLTFNISKRVEISASVSNILNRRNYSYTSYGTISQYERSSQLRGREFLLSIYLKK